MLFYCATNSFMPLRHSSGTILTNLNFYIKKINMLNIASILSALRRDVFLNIPKSINKRLSMLSSDKESFNSEAQIYQNALNKSGYNFTLQYEKQQAPYNKPRRRNIIWFNPPFSKHVATNIGRQFLKIITKVFHSKHPLQKIFNRNTLKLSYSCMPNI